MESLAARLCLLFTPVLCRRDPWDTLRRAIDGGVDLVQWRVKTRDVTGAERCGRVCAEAGVPWTINDDVELAVELGADGAHVGQDDLDAQTARRLLGPDRLLGVSTHDEAQVLGAVAADADYVGFGPMFATATKGYDCGQSDDAVRSALATATLPVFAIGGITPGNASRLLSLGVRRLAVCGAILDADDAGEAALALRGQVNSIASPNE